MQTSVSPLDNQTDAVNSWLEAAKTALKGEPVQSLKSGTLDGIELEPLYSCNQQLAAIIGRQVGRPWKIVHRLTSHNATDGNVELKAAVANGANSIELVLNSSPTMSSSAIELFSNEDVSKMLEDVHLNDVGLRIRGGLDSMAIFASIMATVDSSQTSSDKLDISQVFDLTLGVNSCVGRKQALSRALCLADQLAALDSRGNNARLFSVDSRLWHDAGSNNVLELALCMAQLVESLRLCENVGIKPLQFASRLEVILSADADQFATIAKFRAVRILLRQIFANCEVKDCKIPVHAETSWRMMTLHEPWVNLLRTTMACFSAGTGGADSISILPHDFASNSTDALSLRLARNTQSILLEESNLAKVTDPAAGSGVIEDMTCKFCESAWLEFQKIERAGGLLTAYEDGLVGSMIKSLAESRNENIALGKNQITGVNTFPNLSDKQSAVSLNVTKSKNATGATLKLPNEANGEWFKALEDFVGKNGSLPIPMEEDVNTSNQLECGRLSEPFEILRAKSDKMAEKGNRPNVFLAGLGSQAKFQPMVNFARNFYEVAGIEVAGNDKQTDHDELTELFRKSSAKIVCLCSDSESYAKFGKTCVDAFKDAGATIVHAVGNQANKETVIDELEIDSLIHQGCDMLKILGDTLDAMDNTG